MGIEKKLNYVFLTRKKRARGGLHWIVTITLMCISGYICLDIVLNGENILLLLVSGIIFILSVLHGYSLVARANALCGDISPFHFDNHVLFKGYCKTCRHDNILYADLKNVIKLSFGGAYVFFTCKENNPETCSSISSFPLYIMQPVIKHDVPENELWIDCTNTEVFVNPKTWSIMEIHKVYRHTFAD